MPRLIHVSRVIGLAAVLPLLACLPAAAQGIGGGGIAGSGFQPPVQGAGPKQDKPEQAPPGLPGSQPRNTAAPQQQVPLDVPPTEALFEAINRGDLASARDALNRGADIYGHNVLGMTPIDLSIDLSRNDITFLLMSMRGEASVNGPPAATVPAPAGAKPGKKSLFAKAVPKSSAGQNVARGAAGDAPSARYASVPGPSVPQAGFLGFGPTATP